MSFGVCCLLRVVCCLSFVACCWLFIVHSGRVLSAKFQSSLAVYLDKSPQEDLDDFFEFCTIERLEALIKDGHSVKCAEWLFQGVQDVRELEEVVEHYCIVAESEADFDDLEKKSDLLDSLRMMDQQSLLAQVARASTTRNALAVFEGLRQKLENVAHVVFLYTVRLGFEKTASTETLPGDSKKRRQT